MSIELLIETIVLGIVIIGGLVAIIVALVRGDIKKYIIEQMQEADYLYRDLPKPDKSISKLKYVLDSVNKKYGFVKLFINVKKFVENVVEIANSLQHKGQNK